MKRIVVTLINPQGQSEVKQIVMRGRAHEQLDSLMLPLGHQVTSVALSQTGSIDVPKAEGQTATIKKLAFKQVGQKVEFTDSDDPASLLDHNLMEVTEGQSTHETTWVKPLWPADELLAQNEKSNPTLLEGGAINKSDASQETEKVSAVGVTGTGSQQTGGLLAGLSMNPSWLYPLAVLPLATKTSGGTAGADDSITATSTVIGGTVMLGPVNAGQCRRRQRRWQLRNHIERTVQRGACGSAAGREWCGSQLLE